MNTKKNLNSEILDPVIDGITGGNHSDIKDYETQGFRDAAKVDGMAPAFRNSIVHLYSKLILQESEKKDKIKEKNFEIEQKIEELKNKLALKLKERDDLQQKDLPEAQKEFQDASKELSDFYKNPKSFVREEKDTFLQWIYGFSALTLMIFLYFFYSSVVYSAIFRDVTISKFTIYNSIFYPRALEESWQKGVASFMLTVFAPFIFYAIGIVLDTFKKKLDDPKRKLKYFTGLFFAFILDSILAYHISERIYNSKAINSFETLKPYTLSDALVDLNYWIIIALGFCVYILFGIVFSLYNELRTNSLKYEKSRLELEKIKEEAQQKINRIKEKISSVNDEMKNCELQILELKKEFDKVFYSPIEIKKILSLYTKGWITFLKQGKYPESQIKEIESELNNFYVKIGVIKDE